MLLQPPDGSGSFFSDFGVNPWAWNTGTVDGAHGTPGSAGAHETPGVIWLTGGDPPVDLAARIRGH